MEVYTSMWVCQKIGYCTPNFQSSITIFPIWRAAFSRIPIEMSLSKIVVSQNLLTYWFVIMFPFKLLEWIHYFQRNPKIISVVGYIISIYPRRSPLNHGLIRKKNVSQWFSHHFHTQTAASPECQTLRVTRQGMASRLQHCVEDLHRGI